MLRRLLDRFSGRGRAPVAPEQAVIIRLDGTGLPDFVYEEYDLATLEDNLRAAIGRWRHMARGRR